MTADVPSTFTQALTSRRLAAIRVLAGYALVGSAVSLVGWAANIQRLADWGGSGVAIQPNTTVAVMAAAIAILFIRQRFLAGGLGLFVAAIGLANGFQIVTGTDLGINTLLLFDREWGRVGVINPGQMGTPASISFALIGTSIAILSIFGALERVDRGIQVRRFAVIMAMLTLVIAAFSIVGHIFGAEALYTLPRLTVIAVQTATFILAISMAIVLSLDDVGPMRILRGRTGSALIFRRLVPTIVLLPIILSFLQIQGERYGLYDRSFGVAAMTLAEISLLLFLLWWTGETVVDTEARNTAMFETSLDAVISINHKGYVTAFNPAAERTFGYQAEEAIGAELAELIIPPAMRELHRKGLKHYMETGEGPVLNKRIELTAVRASGEEFPVELSITRIPMQGPPQFTAYLRDITERKRNELAMLQANERLEERVLERTSELHSANAALERSNRELEQFASVASHDLQEPLRKIQAFGDRLLKKYAGDLGEQGRTYVERMDSAATRMRRLIDSLLSYSRVGTKAAPFVMTDLRRIVEDTAGDLEARTLLTKGRIEIGDLPTIEADPSQMTQLFQNLIGNGLKFHRPDLPPVVKVAGAIVDDKFCEITVTDNGVGFEDEYRDRIFEIFRRLHAKSEFEGTGIGLAICRKIVERHGGTITATSSLENGSRFLVRLPIAQTVEEE